MINFNLKWFYFLCKFKRFCNKFKLDLFDSDPVVINNFCSYSSSSFIMFSLKSFIWRRDSSVINWIYYVILALVEMKVFQLGPHWLAGHFWAFHVLCHMLNIKILCLILLYMLYNMSMCFCHMVAVHVACYHVQYFHTKFIMNESMKFIIKVWRSSGRPSYFLQISLLFICLLFFKNKKKQ